MKPNKSYIRAIVVLVSLANLLFVHIAAAQTYQMVDSMSADYYQKGEWKQLDKYFRNVKLEQYQAHSFYQRNALANMQLGNLSRTDRMIRKAVRLNSMNAFTNTIWHDLLLLKGKEAQAIYVGRRQRGYARNALLSTLSLEGGVKYSTNPEPGHMLHISAMLNSRIGYATHIRQFIAFNKQDYFWENFNQITYTFLGTHLLSSSVTFEMPFQYADYRSLIEHSDLINNSTFFNADGNALQQALHWGMNMRYEGSAFSFTGGYSFMQAETKAGYNTRIQTGGNVISGRVDSTDSYAQLQGNITGKYTHYINRKAYSLQLHTFLIDGRDKVYWNFRPSLSAQASKKIWLYGEYWHKGKHMLAIPDAGVLINNFNTQIQRTILSIHYYPNLKYKLEATWMMEWGRDELYQQDLAYQCFFVHLTRYLKR
ncbi:MAG: hypothetical protein ACK4GL_06515 [Flavobacteriales bacterium]